MKIGVTSDTHSYEIPQQLINDFRVVDLIVHAGDFSLKSDYDFFTGINKVKAVFGNTDEAAICNILPGRLIFECEGVKIGLFHGKGSPRKVIDFVIDQFKHDPVDVVIFGHSHFPFNEVIKGVLYFNPGSPNDLVRAPYFSYGLLNISKGKVKGKIVKVK